MANSLLDFVMSVVRDPDAAAHYAANPAQAIADAHLTDVTTADVNQLIPVVTESLSAAVPSTGFDSFDADAGSNVWASGAATAAFDAFGDHLPLQGVDDAHTLVSNVVDTQGDHIPAAIDVGDDFVADDVPAVGVCRRSVAAVRRPGHRRRTGAGHRPGGRLEPFGGRGSPPAARRSWVRHLQLSPELCTNATARPITGRAVVVLMQVNGHGIHYPRRSPNPLIGNPPIPRHGRVERGAAAPFLRAPRVHNVVISSPDSPATDSRPHNRKALR